MDLDRIDQLLDKYWECRTSVEEEKELKAFFTHRKVPEKWKNITPLFKYYEEEKQNSQLDGGFDERLLAKLEGLKNPKSSGKHNGKIVRIFYDVAKVAAVGLVLAAATYFVREEYMNKEDQMAPYLTDTFEDPKEAFEETKKALMLISGNFNKGRKEAQKLGVFNQAREKVKDSAINNKP